MTKQQRTAIARQLKTAEDLVRFARQRLESERATTHAMLRDVQADLEEAERITAVAAQDCGDEQ